MEALLLLILLVAPLALFAALAVWYGVDSRVLEERCSEGTRRGWWPAATLD